MNKDLFISSFDHRVYKKQPLAERMRPHSLNDVTGQSHLVGEKGLLSRIVAAGSIGSMIFGGLQGQEKQQLRVY